MSVARDMSSVIADVQAAMKRGMMLDAWEIARESGVPLEKWPQGQPRRLAARLASSLGNARLGDALHWLNWRENRQDPSLYFQALFARGRWTPGIRLRDEIEERLKQEMPDESRAELLAYQAWIWAVTRDFEPAHVKIAQALALDPRDSWLHLQYSSILEIQDRYVEALEQALKALELRPNYRPAVLQCVDVLIHLGRDDEALAFLTEAHGQTQQAAFPLRMQSIYSEREDHVNALRCLDEAERLSPLATESLKKWMAGRRADFLYMAGDLDGCLEWCDRKGEGFQKTIAENLRKPGAREKRRVKLPVPFVRQHRMTCAPATLSALAAYWGKHHHHLEIADAICHEGTPWHKERGWALSHGFIAREFRVTAESLRALIDRGVPFTLTTQWTMGAHLQACIGYDERTGAILLRDPTERHFGEMILEDLIKQHPINGPRGMVILPPEEAARLEGLILPDEAAYEANHELLVALDGHDRWQAEAALVTLRAVAPGSMLALQGETRVAAYLRDFSRELTATEALLERAPDHGWLLLRKSYLLGQLGRRAERRELLVKSASEEGAEPVFVSELGELLLQDARELPLAEHHLKRALRRRMLEARCYESLARCRSKQHRHEEAAVLRRAAATLAPDFEGYARAYFDTCRILRRTDEGLEFLRSRTRLHGRKESGPWITLASCLDLVRNDREALTVLEEARAALPDDGGLLLEAGSMMAGWGGELRDRGRQWIEAARGKVPESDWLRSSAHNASFIGDRKLAILRWRTLLGIEPQAIDAWRSLAKLAAEEEGERAAFALIDEAVAKFPNQSGLWALQAEWKRRKPEEALPALGRMIELDRHDRWAWRERALHLEDAGRKEEAVADAREAVALDPGDASSRYILGSILKDMGRRADARLELKEALRIDIDQVDAAHCLMDLAADRAESLESIHYIDAEMRRQVSTGEIVPSYQALAWRFVEPPVLLGYLQEFCQQRPDLWQTWSARVTQALQMRFGGEALLAAQKLTENFPLLPRAWIVLAEVHRAEGRFAEEERALATAVDLSPGWDEAAREHADVLERMGRLKEAEAVWRKALLLKPLTAANYGYLAAFLDRSGRREEADALLKKAAGIAPFYSWGWEKRAAWARESGREESLAEELRETGERHASRRAWWSQAADIWMYLDRKDESIAAIRRGLALAPEDITLRDQLAQRLCEDGQYPEALAACAAVAGEDRTPTPMEGRHAWVLMHSGQPVKAIETMQALLERQPDYVWGMRELASWLSRRRDWEKLRDLAKKWVRSSPGELQAWEYLGHVERQLRQTKEAKKAYAHAHSMYPDSAFAGRQLADIQMELGEFDEAAATIKLLRHYAPSSEITCDAIELALKRGDLASALAEAGHLITDEDAEVSTFEHTAKLFHGVGRQADWNKWLAGHVEGGIVPAPGALAAYLQSLPAKRQFSESIRWITREAEGCKSRVAAWAWLIRHAGESQRADLLRQWIAQKHHSELHGNAELWEEVGSAMLDAGMSDEGAQWFSDWRKREDEVTADVLMNLAVMYENSSGDHARTWQLAAEARGEGLKRFPGNLLANPLRGAQAFYCAVEGRVEEAKELLAEFEPKLTTEYYQQVARFAEAIVASAESRTEEAKDKARRSLTYIACYPNDKALQRKREKGELALVSHHAWTRGKISRLRKEWALPKPGKASSQDSGWAKPSVGWIAFVIFVAIIKSCSGG